MIVVMGIIVLLVLLAVPAIRSLTGSRSIDAGYNTLNALITRAREEAVGLQEVRGVLFYVEPTSDRIVAAIVKTVPLVSLDHDQSHAATDPNPDPATYYLDLVPDRDSLTLPQGIGVQVVNDPGLGTPAYTDRYIGFNPIPATVMPASTAAPFGGVLLFDGNGRLLSKNYGLKLIDRSPSVPVASQIALALGSNGTMPNSDYTPLPTTNTLLSSQFGFVLFDREAFKTAGFTDGDTGLDPAVNTNYSSGPPADEASEETWLDANSTPILVNRYNGTLIRAE